MGLLLRAKYIESALRFSCAVHVYDIISDGPAALASFLGLIGINVNVGRVRSLQLQQKTGLACAF